MPMAFRASLTSSNLNGWTIASIFFIFTPLLGFEIVAFFAVHTYIETCNLVLLVDADANQQITDFKRDQRSHNAEQRRYPAPDQLIYHLHSVAIHQPERRRLSGTVLQRIVHRIR